MKSKSCQNLNVMHILLEKKKIYPVLSVTKWLLLHFSTSLSRIYQWPIVFRVMAFKLTEEKKNHINQKDLTHLELPKIPKNFT